MKKYMTMFLVIFMAIFCLSACKGNNVNTSKDNKIKIVTTIFPEYDWVKEILGDKAEYAEITMLLDNGVDLHSYQPTADDIMKISTCDMFIYVGGESDEWVDDVLKEANNKDMKVINLLDILGDFAKTEEIVDGMQYEEEDDNHSHDEEVDEHVWLSLKNAEIFCKAISDALQEIDSDNKEIYYKNTLEYIEKLNALDNEYSEVIGSSHNKTILFGDRFPFRYLVDDYGLSYYAAFVGCSAETEASFETVTFLARKVDELGLNSILTIEKSDDKLAETIVKNTNSKDQKIMSLDSMQSTTSKDVAKGATYISIMENNLEILKEVLK